MKLIGYLSNGYPSLEESVEIFKNYADAGCDVIEVDLPARDPYLENDLISGRMAAALKFSDDYGDYMQNIVEMKASVGDDVELLLVAYVTTVLEIGVDRFIEFCRDNGFMDLILVGLEDETVKERLIEAGIRVSCYVQRALYPAEVNAAKDSNGFVYLQAKSDEVNPDYPTLSDSIDFLRSEGIDRPIYCGVGIYTPEDFKAAKEAGADGAFVGSAILEVSDDPVRLRDTIGSFTAVRD